MNVYTIVGLAFVAALSLIAIAIAVASIISSIRYRRRLESNLRNELLSNCAEIDRWCDYEFPQIGFFVRELSECLRKGYKMDANTMREKLREQFGTK